MVQGKDNHDRILQISDRWRMRNEKICNSHGNPTSKQIEILGNNINQPAGFRHGKILA